MIIKAEQLLQKAASYSAMGRFQLEAGVQSVPCNRLLGGKIDGYGVLQLYRGLLQIRPTVGVAGGRAEAVGAEQGLLCLEQIQWKESKLQDSRG